MAADDVADRLYGLPLEEFTAERDKAARELRREGSKEEADRVKKLKKPSAAAWAGAEQAPGGAGKGMGGAKEALAPARGGADGGGRGRERKRGGLPRLEE